MKFSILGYGHIGKVHENAILQTQEAKLVAIIDEIASPPSEEMAFYTSLDLFLENDKETEVVCIATPNGLHKTHAIKCLKAGKNVFIEKPLALNLEDAQEILDVAKKEGLRVFSSMQLRFSPVVQYVKSLVEKNALGQIYMVNIQCYWNRNKTYYDSRKWHGTKETDGGVLFTQFSHFIDIMNFWFQENNIVNALTYNFNHQEYTEFPDSGKIDFDADGTAGNMIFTTSTFQKNFESSITLIAEKGTIKIGDQYLNQIKYIDLEENFEIDLYSTDKKGFHPDAIQEICHALNEKRDSILDGEHALRLVKFISDAYKVAEKKEVHQQNAF